MTSDAGFFVSGPVVAGAGALIYVACMTTLTITAEGQITLTKELLKHLGLQPGNKVEVTCEVGGRLTLAPQRIARTGRIEDVVGALHRPGQKALSIEEMNQVIARAWAGEVEP